MANLEKLSASEHCYRGLSRRIVSLELKPNEPVGEEMLAHYFGVSRTPVREALSRLSTERLVDFRSRAGAIVSPIRLGAVRTAQFVREKLEMGIVAEAALRAPSNSRIGLGIRQAIEEQELAISESDTDVFFEADERMHSLYCRLAELNEVWDFVSNAKKHMDRVRRLSIRTGDLSELVEDHHRLCAAVLAGDGGLAQQIMQTHLRRVMIDLPELSERFPDYFQKSA